MDPIAAYSTIGLILSIIVFINAYGNEDGYTVMLLCVAVFFLWPVLLVNYLIGKP